MLTLDTLGEVPEVEDIVGLCWCGQEVCAHTSINLRAGGETESGGKLAMHESPILHVDYGT